MTTPVGWKESAVIGLTDENDFLDALAERVDFLLDAVESGSLEVSHDLYLRLLGPDHGRA